MVVIDSSVLINYFNGVLTFETDFLAELIKNKKQIIIGDLILLEVLQGFKNDNDFITAKNTLESFDIPTMAGHNISVESANNYRLLRKKGLTIRKTIDVIIATFCIKNNYRLLYSDRDFDIMEKHLGLKSINSN